MGGAAQPKASTSAPVPTVDDSTGSVTGRVLDEEMQPIAGADVGIRGQLSLVAKTDNLGRFTINGVTPGKLVLDVQRLGFESSTKSVDVAAGEVSEVQIVLVALMVEPEGFVQMIPLKAYMQFGATTPVVTLRPGILLNDKLIFTNSMNKGVRHTLSEMSWQSSAPLAAKKMRLDTTADGKALSNRSAPSPLTVFHEYLNTTKKADIVHNVWLPFSCDIFMPTTCTGVPDSLAVVVYEQRFDIYISLFFSKDREAGYTAVPA